MDKEKCEKGIKPEECTPEQAKKCHDEEEAKKKAECEKGMKPGECTPEQIKKCHGDVKKHPCDENKFEKKPDK